MALTINRRGGGENEAGTGRGWVWLLSARCVSVVHTFVRRRPAILRHCFVSSAVRTQLWSLSCCWKAVSKSVTCSREKWPKYRRTFCLIKQKHRETHIWRSVEYEIFRIIKQSIVRTDQSRDSSAILLYQAQIQGMWQFLEQILVYNSSALLIKKKKNLAAHRLRTPFPSIVITKRCWRHRSHKPFPYKWNSSFTLKRDRQVIGF